MRCNLQLRQATGHEGAARRRVCRSVTHGLRAAGSVARSLSCRRFPACSCPHPQPAHREHLNPRVMSRRWLCFPPLQDHRPLRQEVCGRTPRTLARAWLTKVDLLSHDSWNFRSIGGWSQALGTHLSIQVGVSLLTTSVLCPAPWPAPSQLPLSPSHVLLGFGTEPPRSAAPCLLPAAPAGSRGRAAAVGVASSRYRCGS